MEDYVRRYTAGSILRSAIRIYRFNAPVLIGSALVPSIPTILIEVIRWRNEPAVWLMLPAIFLGFLNFAPFTVLISDICVGNEPSVRRAYRLAFGKLTGRVLLTFVLSTLAVMGGTVLLVVPGIIFFMWYAFGGSVVVLERTTARGALSRSRELGKGHYRRNLGILILTALVTAAPFQILVAISSLVIVYSGLPLSLSNVIASLLGALGAVPTSVVVVLLYYDMRVRNEAYDSTKLAEDLRR